MPHTSSHSNGKQAGIRRPAMAAVVLVLALIGMAIAPGRAEAQQSNLPPCPSSKLVRWNNCFAILIFAEEPFKGDKYEGEFKNNKKSGKATYTFANGNIFVGEYKDDKRNGLGIYTYTDGDKFVGEWKDDKPNGQGTYTFANGDIYVGEYKDGKHNGQGTATCPSSEHLGQMWS